MSNLQTPTINPSHSRAWHSHVIRYPIFGPLIFHPSALELTSQAQLKHYQHIGMNQPFDTLSNTTGRLHFHILDKLCPNCQNFGSLPFSDLFGHTPVDADDIISIVSSLDVKLFHFLKSTEFGLQDPLNTSLHKFYRNHTDRLQSRTPWYLRQSTLNKTRGLLPDVIPISSVFHIVNPLYCET